MSERAILRLDNDGKPMHYYQSVKAKTDDEVRERAAAVVVSNIQVSRRGDDPQLWLSEKNYRIVEAEEGSSIMADVKSRLLKEARVEPELVNVV